MKRHRQLTSLADLKKQQTRRNMIKLAEHPCLCCKGEGTIKDRECPRCEGTGTDRAMSQDFYQPSY